MSLTEALNLSQAGINIASRRISNASNNIVNADKEGFTRKSVQNQFISTDTSTFPVGSIIVNTANELLQRAVVEDNTNVNYNEVRARYLTELTQEIGTTGGQNSFSAGYGNLLNAFDALATNPEGASTKIEVVNAADEFAVQVRRYAGAIQDQRAQADAEIGQTVNDINRLLREIDNLNDSIVRRTNSSPTDQALELQDERQVKLEEISGLLDVQFFENSDGRINIYATGGPPLLTGAVRQLDFSSVGTVDSSTLHPAGFNPIELEGADLTTVLTGGKIGSLIEMRDSVLVDEQIKIDEFTLNVLDEVNAVLNKGASIPSPNSLVGSTGFAAGDALPSSGSFRIARLDSTGTITGFSDINLGAIGTVGAFIATINAQPGLTATIDPDGRAIITATNPAEGIAFNELDSDVGADNRGISHYFGFNNLFDGDVEFAEQIQVKDEFRLNPSILPTGTLNGDVAPLPLPVVGDPGLLPGDQSTALNIVSALRGDVSFNAAGNLGAQNTTLQNYANTIIGSLASDASFAQSVFDSSLFSFDALKERMLNEQGVNIDEELSNITLIENSYQASAQVLSTVQELFDSLLQAVN